MAEQAQEMVVDATPKKATFMNKRSTHEDRIKKDEEELKKLKEEAQPLQSVEIKLYVPGQRLYIFWLDDKYSSIPSLFKSADHAKETQSSSNSGFNPAS